MLDVMLRILRRRDDEAYDKVMQLEGEINMWQQQCLAQHSQRLCERKCEPLTALIYVDYINNMEKIGDHITNVAQAARGGFSFERIGRQREDGPTTT
ncbi:PhoU domain-containing protein, partial [Candidatus Omnitrophota bacterium]